MNNSPLTNVMISYLIIINSSHLVYININMVGV
ncbi:hypothetical protein [Staphylococcus phage vB_ScaM-V1SC01]|nr:hypothetical protein [Staphylococcus phage vB_ScaM-V1SC01]WPF67604.1 hypothetical protein [Staphylococcus phage vB_SauM-V1SA12]